MVMSLAEMPLNGTTIQSAVRKGQLFPHQENVQRPAIPAFQRTPKVPLENVPGKLPRARLPDDIDCASVAEQCILKLNTLQLDAFDEDALWRDLYALTGLPRTFYGRAKILSVWNEVGAYHHPRHFLLVPGTARLMSPESEVGWVQANYRFETFGTPATLCSGQIGLIPNGKGGWKIWLLTTILEQLQGFHSPDEFRPSCDDGNGLPQIQGSRAYECIVVGAGFAGLCLSARLKALDVRYVTLEKNARVGDNWRNRYESATCEDIRPRGSEVDYVLLRHATWTVHTGRNMSDFPLDSVFTEEDPYFLNQKDLARGYEAFARTNHLVSISGEETQSIGSTKSA